MPGPAPGALHVRAKANHIVDYHYDDEQPGKPLYLLIPGGLVALASLALIVYIAYATWYEQTIDPNIGPVLILILAPFYIGGVFVFCYGYELYDVSKALRDTAIIVFITLASVVIIAVLFFVVGELGGGRSSGSSDSKSSVSSHSGSTASVGGGGGGGGWIGGAGPLFINTGSGTNTVTHEVVREAPVAPLAPQPITCPNCGRSYLPAENHFACPNCGAPAPPELTEASSAGAQDRG